MGYNDAQLLDHFYQRELIRIEDGKFERKLNFGLIRGQRATRRHR